MFGECIGHTTTTCDPRFVKELTHQTIAEVAMAIRLVVMQADWDSSASIFLGRGQHLHNAIEIVLLIEKRAEIRNDEEV